jgi:hypothetical protein
MELKEVVMIIVYTHRRRRLTVSMIIALGCMALAWGSAALGAEDNIFLRQTIDVSGTVLGTRQADINGDGLTDLIVFSDDPSGRRLMLPYIQRSTGRFPPGSGPAAELSPTANMAQVMDLDGDGRSEIYIVDQTGMWRYKYEGEAFSDPRQVIDFPTILVGTIRNGLLAQECIRTVSNHPTVFLPTMNGYTLWRFTAGKFKRTATLPFSHYMSVGERPVKLFGRVDRHTQARFEISTPAIMIGHSNADDLEDIYLVWSDRMKVFTQNEDGTFGSTSDMFRFQESTEGNLCQARMVDYDRDGRLDIVCSQSQGGISGASTSINFYHSSQIRRRDNTRNNEVTLSDACGNLMIDDFNGGGGLELVVPAIELGIMSTVKKMITKKTDVHILIYPIDNLGRPSEEPRVRKKISCRLDFENSDPTADIRIDWSGDYNGDGLKDLVMADGNGELLFWSGDAENYIENDESLSLEMSRPDVLLPTRLNGDAQSDLIVIHKGYGGSTRITMLLTNPIT